MQKSCQTSSFYIFFKLAIPFRIIFFKIIKKTYICKKSPIPMRINTIIILLTAFLACQTMAAQSSLSMPGKQKPTAGQTVNTPKQKQKHKKKTDTTTAPKQKPLTGTINGHEWVDLGLPSGLKWATCNVGASSPEQYGDYFAWGETKTKSSYTQENSETQDKDKTWLINNGYISNAGNLKPSHDAAAQHWMSSWRMPSEKEIRELVDNTTSTWTTYNGVNGRLFTSKHNGQSIFIPAAGGKNAKGSFYCGENGSTWSSTLKANEYDSSKDALAICFEQDDWMGCIGSLARYCGRPVRPVTK